MKPADSPKPDHRLRPRKPARTRSKVVCRKGTMELGPNLAYTLLDVSESGVRFLAKTQLKRDDEVSLELEGPLHARPLKRVGRVAWSVATADGKWCVGVAMDHFLTRQDVEMLT